MKSLKIILKCLGLILLYMVLQEFTGLVASFYKGNLLYQNIILIVGTLFTTILFVFIFRKDLVAYFKNFKENYSKTIPKCIKYWLIGFVITYIINIIISVFLLHGIAPNEEANRLMLKTYPIYMALSVCITSPICEELLFRLGFKNAFKRRIPYVLFTGILFGAAHLIVSERLIDLVYIFSYSALGITFSLVCYDTDNIFSSIFTHILHNTVIYLMLIAFI